MGKSLFIAEKPSVAREFAKALNENMQNRDGYMESENAIVTWCFRIAKSTITKLLQ